MRNLPIQTSNRRGFTIIEVVLVLAIAGLIFLMVFIALPNMQAAQRNTQRRNDYNSLATQITNFATNHNGAQPTATQVKSTWFNSQGTDPDGNTYSWTIKTTTDTNKPGRNSNQAFIFMNTSSGFKCSDAGEPAAATGKKEFAIYGYVEEGANVAGTYCLASHM